MLLLIRDEYINGLNCLGFTSVMYWKIFTLASGLASNLPGLKESDRAIIDGGCCANARP